MITVYYVDGSLVAPEPVECEKPDYPLRDAKGRVIYENSHYINVEDAWEALGKDVRSAVLFAARRVSDLRKQLEETERAAADVVVRAAAYQKGFEEFRGDGKKDVITEAIRTAVIEAKLRYPCDEGGFEEAVFEAFPGIREEIAKRSAGRTPPTAPPATAPPPGS